MMKRPLTLLVLVIAVGCTENQPVQSMPDSGPEVIARFPFNEAGTGLSAEEVWTTASHDGTHGEVVVGWARAASFLEDGRVVFADGYAQHVALLDDEGRLVSTFGRPGEGPGEFRGISFVQPLGADSLVAYDEMAGRGTVFSLEGDVGRTFDLPWVTGGGRAAGFRSHGDETLLILGKDKDPRDKVDTTIRDTVRLTLFDNRTLESRDLGVMLPDRWWSFSRTGGAFSSKSPPGGPYAIVGLTSHSLLLSSNEAGEIGQARLSDLPLTDSTFQWQVGLSPNQPVDIEVRGYFSRSEADWENEVLWVTVRPEAGAEPLTQRWWRVGKGVEMTYLELPLQHSIIAAQGDRLLISQWSDEGGIALAVLSISPDS